MKRKRLLTFKDWAKNIDREDRYGETYKGDINCMGVAEILEGAPKHVKGDFTCSGSQLISLQGGPEIVDGRFMVNIASIKDFRGAPKKVQKFVAHLCRELTSTKGFPKDVQGSIAITVCPNLTKIEDFPDEVHGDLDFSRSGITSLEGCPQFIRDKLLLINTKITSLKGCPKEVEFIDATTETLEKLEDYPEDVEDVIIHPKVIDKIFKDGLRLIEQGKVIIIPTLRTRSSSDLVYRQLHRYITREKKMTLDSFSKLENIERALIIQELYDDYIPSDLEDLLMI